MMRRSSRQVQPPPSNSTSTTSGPSSTASMRGERSTRSNNKQASPQKSATPQSALSSDSADPVAGRDEAPQSRRSRRGQDNAPADVETNPKVEGEEVEEDQAEENEVTRCVCGQQEYPGPPEIKHSKSNHPAVDAQSDDAGGLFIQCDVCKVWQHGGCVGIMDEAHSPDDYFCEQCRPKLHEVSTAKNGQKYSLYLPVYEKFHAKNSHRKPSTSRDTDTRVAKEQEKQARADALAKRRSTMNSRSAYDEEEVLRAVLEQSKKEGAVLAPDNGTRKTKRGRDESEDASKDAKRQRTASDLSSDKSEAESQAGDSDGENKGGKQAPRGAAARSQRERELRDRERDRAEAANKRSRRADRRRGEDSEPPTDQNLARPSTAPSDADGPTSQPPDTPQLGPVNKSHKKGAKGAGKRGKNQWTRDSTQTPLEGDAAQTNGDRKSRRGAEDASPARNRSGENTDGGSGGKDPADGEQPEPAPVVPRGHGRGKPKVMNIHKTSMNEMRRKVNNMLQFISQAQVDMASKKSYQLAVHAAANGAEPTSDPRTNDATRKATATEAEKESEKENEKEKEKGAEGSASGSNSTGSTRGFNKTLDEFKTLPPTEMMNLLSTQLVLWQQEYGKLGEK